MPRTMPQVSKRALIEQQFQSSSHEVDLSDSFIGEDLCQYVIQLLKKYRQTKTSVNLRGNQIQGEGAKELAMFLKGETNLSRLLLEWNNIGLFDHGMIELANALTVNTTLTELDLRNNNIGPTGAQCLAKALRRNTTLTSLDLRWNCIGSVGGQDLVSALEKNFALTQVFTSGNDIPSTIVARMDSLCERNELKFDRDKGVLMDENAMLLECLTDREQTHQLIKTMKQKIQHSEEQLTDTRSSLNLEREKHAQLRTEYTELSLSMEQQRQKQETSDLKSATTLVKLQERIQLLESDLGKLKDELDVKTSEMSQMEGKHAAELQEAVEVKRRAVSEVKKKELYCETLLRETERLRDQHEEERQRWNEDRSTLQLSGMEKYQALETRMQHQQDQVVQQLDQMHQKVAKAEQARATFQRENDTCRGENLRLKLQQERLLTELESKMQLEMDTRVKNTLDGIEAKLKHFQEARDEAQETITSQTKQLLAIQEQHQQELCEYEQMYTQEKQSSLEMQQKRVEKESQVLQLQTKVHHLETKLGLAQSQNQQQHAKNAHLETIHSQHLAHVQQTMQEDRSQWEKAMDEKTKIISTLETSAQDQALVLSELRQTQEQRLNEMSDSIQEFLMSRFHQEREKIKSSSAFGSDITPPAE